jgi:hypothetical protein
MDRLDRAQKAAISFMTQISEEIGEPIEKVLAPGQRP